MAEHALRLTPEQIQEFSLVDLALELLKQTNKPYYFRDLMNEIAQLRGMTQDEVNDVIARLYTEINMDGRFLCVGNGVWGLKRWYPTDKTAEKSVGGKKFLRKDVDWEDEEDEDVVYDEEEEDLVTEDAEEEDIYLYGRNEEDSEDGEDGEDLDIAIDEDDSDAMLDEEDLDDSLGDEDELEDELDEDLDGDDESDDDSDDDL